MAEKVQINLQLEAEEKRMIEKNAKDEGVSVSEFIRMKCVDECGYYLIGCKEGKNTKYLKTSGFDKDNGTIKIDTTDNIAQAEVMTFGKAKSLKEAIEMFKKDKDTKREWFLIEDHS